MKTRREFLSRGVQFGLATGLGDLGFLNGLPRLSAADTALPATAVRFGPDIEPLVRLIEETPRERLLEEVGARLRRGLTYRELLTALMLAGVRNIQPRPVGFKFHAVLVVNSAHLASLASADADRWLPIFWSLDQFKSSQAADVQQGDWALSAVEASRVPPGHRARQSLVAALDAWDEAAADAAIVGLLRVAGAHEIFELLCRYGVRDFRELGHKQIYIANSFRLLEVIGWQHAEPILRSLVYALLDRVGDSNPSRSDLPADRPFRRNVTAAREIRPDWTEGRSEDAATREVLESCREGSALDTSRLTVALLNRGVTPTSVWDGLHAATGELLMRSPGIASLHATTFTNAVRYAWERVQDDELRRLLLLQNAAFLPLFRGQPRPQGVRLDSLEPESKSGAAPEDLATIFAQIGPDTLAASRNTLAWLQANPDPQPFADAARRLIFLKGRDSHDYKFSSAVFEDFRRLSPGWRDRVLAASVFNLRGTAASDNELVARSRAALVG
ncbi:MAG: hypothetical protein J0L84_19650 [Verrucomicrobia bacterium]|nr:hypothetical protein [Verrucomicrobiota bacterium]